MVLGFRCPQLVGAYFKDLETSGKTLDPDRHMTKAVSREAQPEALHS